MHNCKRTKDALIDLALNELGDAQAGAVASELQECQTCRSEQLAISGALQVSRQALSADHRSEEFWTSYRQRLQHKLRQQSPVTVQSSSGSRLWAAVRTFMTTSVRVPLPAALAALALVSVLSFVAISRGQVNSSPMAGTTRVEVQTVHVPVVQEKVVRQVVYRDRKRSKGHAVDYANLNTATAKAVSDRGAKLNLVEFKPADQVKMTIIKGNDQDEK